MEACGPGAGLPDCEWLIPSDSWCVVCAGRSLTPKALPACDAARDHQKVTVESSHELIAADQLDGA
jgi:hypothetical protein